MSQIKITKYKNKIQITGHSMPDICAAVSSVVYTSVNMIITLTSPDAITFEDNKDDDFILITVHSRKEKVKQGVDVMMHMFEDIADMAPVGTISISDLNEV